MTVPLDICSAMTNHILYENTSYYETLNSWNPSLRNRLHYPTNWDLRNKHRNSKLMTCYYSDLGNTSVWLKQIFLVARSMKSTTQILVVTCHQYGISYTHFSEDILQRNELWHCGVSAVFSDYLHPGFSCSWIYSFLINECVTCKCKYTFVRISKLCFSTGGQPACYRK